MQRCNLGMKLWSRLEMPSGTRRKTSHPGSQAIASAAFAELDPTAFAMPSMVLIVYCSCGQIASRSRATKR